jgi:hypothetical protein
MKQKRPFRGAEVCALASVQIIPHPTPEQNTERLRVSPELARLAAYTRRQPDRLHLGKHRRRMAAYRLRRCA